MKELLCVSCKKPLSLVPIFNDGKDEEFASSLLFCTTEKCDRHGLLTVTYKTKKSKKRKNAKSKRKTV